MKLKRIIVAALIFALLLNINISVTAEDEFIYHHTPALTIQSVSSGNAFSGRSFRVDVSVRNNMAFEITGVSVAVDASSGPVTLESISPSLERGVNPGTSVFSFFFRANNTGTAQIRFVVSQFGVPFDRADTTVIIAEEPEAPPSIDPVHHFEIMSEMYSPPSRQVSAGQTFRIGFRVVNRGEITRNVMASLVELPQGLRATTQPVHILGDMLIGQSEFIEFTIEVTNQASEGLHMFWVEITGSGGPGAGSGRTRRHPLSITVDNTGIIDVINPNFIFTDIQLPENTDRGERFTLSATVENIGADARNVSVELNRSAGIGSFSSDTVQIGSLGKGERQSVSFDLIVRQNAPDYWNEMSLTAAGENSDGAQAQATRHTGLTVTPEEEDEITEIEIQSAAIPESIDVGGRFEVTVTAVNNGESEVRNLNLAVTSPNGILNLSSEQASIPLLGPGETHTLRIQYEVTSQAGGGFQSFRAEFTGGGETVSRHFGTFVNTSDLRIENITAPSSVRINENVTFADFTVEVTVRNTGAEARDLTLTLASQATGITNISPNPLRIDRIGRDETVTRSFTFRASEAAHSGYATINISLAHESQTIQQFSGTNIINQRRDDEREDGRLPMPVVIINRFSYEVIVPDDPGPADDFNNQDGFGPGGDFGFDGSFGFDGNFPMTRPMPHDGEFEEVIFEPTRMIVDQPVQVMPGGGFIIAGGARDRIGGDTPGGAAGPVAPPRIRDSDAVLAGRSFMFTFELLNPHREVAAIDLTVTITSAGTAGTFNPVRGSNTFFIEYLGPGQSVERSIELFVRADAAPESHGLIITLTYRNEDVTVAAVTTPHTINIPVRQELRFSIGEIPPIAPVELGDEAFIRINIGNLGRSLIFNAMVRVVGEGFSNWDGNWHAGNIQPGNFTNNDFFLMTMAPGFINGEFIFTYEDAEGNEYEERRPFFFQVTGGDGMDGGWPGGDGWPGEMPGEEGDWEFDEETGQMVWVPRGMPQDDETGIMAWISNNLMWVIIGASAVVVIAGVIITVVAVRKKRAKDDEYDDDPEE